MGIYVNPGSKKFKEALRSEIYVDKSMLLQYTNRLIGTTRKAVCVSRPRRFGKSIAADMLAAYYDKSCDSSEMFQNLKIAGTSDEVHAGNISILEYNDENALSCVISLAYYNAVNEYILVREMPGGKGYADIIFLSGKYSDKPAMIVELKYNQSAEGAIAQIKEKNYVRALEAYKGKILPVGINYDRKTKVHECKIEQIEQ